jgi:hypothetical protein
MNLTKGDTAALIRLSGGRNQSGPSEKGVMRPDARDLINNAGNSLANPYNGNYPWVIPPPSETPISARGTLPAPANGTQIVLVSFQVPQAMEAVITDIVCQVDGFTFDEGSGEVVWTVDINRPLGSTTNGYNPPFFGTINTELGDYRRGLPFPIRGGIRLSERDTIRVKVTTAAPVPVGPPNVITAMLLGWYYPVKLAFPIQGIGG